MDKDEVPEHFICPISLEIMKDPVTTVTGITYDRESIQRWQFESTATSRTPKCPVTMQPLSGVPNLTPNHTLRRLIQTWCSANPTRVVGPIPTAPPSQSHITSLIHDLRHHPSPRTRLETLRKLESLASKSKRIRVLLSEADPAADSLISFVESCRESRSAEGLEEALSLFHLIWARPRAGDEHVVASLLWILAEESFDDQTAVVVKTRAACLLRAAVQSVGPATLEHLRLEFFEAVLSGLRPENSVSQEGVVSLLHVVLETCLSARNRALMVELGAVAELIEVEARCGGERRTTELVLEILCYLCSCAGGRAQLVGHPDGIPLVTRQMLRVSPAADDSAVFVVWLVSKYSGSDGHVARLMERARTHVKLCSIVLAADRKTHLKEKAKEVLRMHAGMWRVHSYGVSMKVFH
ncbi:U-box domain-containing family protein [Striga asiatica]|uniref:U-box domain-containing protein n=1 Tax=Striga asiatica TaxID=4170 RepID=A0A5A7Q9X7_STRAF|nr:U-box domain-containing family protein [Striga asiatica]